MLQCRTLSFPSTHLLLSGSLETEGPVGVEFPANGEDGGADGNAADLLER